MIHIAKGKGLRRIVEKVRGADKPLAFGGTVKTWTSVDIGGELYLWVAEVDMRGIESMAARAAHSKGGKCVDGPLVVRIYHREDRP